MKRVRARGRLSARLETSTRPHAQVQMLVGQLKNREQELAKKGRIVDYEREAALAGVRTMIHDLEGADAVSSLFSRHRRGGGMALR